MTDKANTCSKQFQHQNQPKKLNKFINTACMAPPWFARATSCCFGFLTGTRAPLFSLTNFRLVAILTNLLGVRKNCGLNERKKLRCVRIIEMKHRLNLVPRSLMASPTRDLGTRYQVAGFCSMKRPEVFLLPPGWNATSLSQSYPQH